MPTRDELLDLFRRSGALLEGHFRLSSGLHSTGLSAVRAGAAASAARRTARPGDRRAHPRAAPDRRAVAGARRRVIGHEVGRALGVRAIFAERQDGVLTLRRGFMICERDRVLVIEDVLTTGGSTRETMQVAAAAGGQVVGAAADRRSQRRRRRPRRAVPRAAGDRAADLRARACPLCAQGLPVVKPGSRPSRSELQNRRIAAGIAELQRRIAG